VRPPANGSAHRLTAPYEAFPTSDGWVNVGGANAKLWERLCRSLGLEALLDDDRFRENPSRVRNRAELAELISAQTRVRGTDELVALLTEAEIPCGPILGYDQILEHEHARAREMVVEQEHPVAGEIRVLGVPVKLSASPGAVRAPAPALGRDTDEVLAGLGYEPERVAALRARGVVA
jgi:crotonobetainyl-CoA:carnitine CoA-transferase CaiB-like acyl-CoA transferase